MAKYQVTAAEPQKAAGKGQIQKFRCIDMETNAPYPHIVQIWNQEVKSGDILEGTIEEKKAGDQNQYTNYQFKKPSTGFGGGAPYTGPTAEQSARQGALIASAILFPTDKKKRDETRDAMIKFILG